MNMQEILGLVLGYGMAAIVMAIIVREMRLVREAEPLLLLPSPAVTPEETRRAA